MKSQPTTTLENQAKAHLEDEFPDEHATAVRVVWWDEGGHLREVVRTAADQIGVGFSEAERFPLELRKTAVKEPESPHVWYIPEAKTVEDAEEGLIERDWFRDIRETGGEIELTIEQLTAELYEVNPWDIYDVERGTESDRETAANVIKNQFASGGIPRYGDLIGEIITKGEGQILEHLLEGGWPEIDKDDETIARVQKSLKDRHVAPADSAETPEEIEDVVWKWAVARWLVAEGIDVDAFPGGYGNVGSTLGDINPLKRIVDTRQSTRLAERYLSESYWEDVIGAYDDAWELAACPVDGALDAALWDAWLESLEEEEYTKCIERANERQRALEVYPDDIPWTTLWKQAEQVAKLEARFSAWEERSKSLDPFDQYSAQDDGTWKIDYGVLELEITGEPEQDRLLNSHPATGTLPELRSELLETRYMNYLEEMSEAVISSFSTGSPLAGKDAAYEWWTDNENELATGETVALFLIDALRLDLARELANRLREDYSITEDTRVSTLPSETKFGMAALTPGRAHRFRIKLRNGKLSVERGGQRLDNKGNRVKVLEREGWDVPEDSDSGWQRNQIAYYDKDIDDIGENELDNPESHFTDYIDELYDLITEELENGNRDRIYVVTDHGFVLLPKGTTMESISSYDGDGEVKYRRIAGDDIEDAGTGVRVTGQTPGTEYLNTSVRLLAKPRQYNSKSGLTDARYYHGGILPQECMLNFLRIEKE
ncbi:BREX-5 system phosphatase PglZ [Haladaptatus sp. T7]|uniref:BREX-5 system phosphatase PglZ n=1 Tax=Haladaptatus sp. T7 TaxID=2029368 RepID=UPI0021A25779|nr:BREX-5 system phosphatase PglZ [Haladaptatus sp. T7]GKZ16279.1 hypothetical protein HAL_41600 [Haladaptatus sp. T7]